MAKTKTLKEQRKSSKKSKVIILTKHDPYEINLANKERVKAAIYFSLLEGDLESVQDLLIAHLETVNKLQLSSTCKIGRQTLYDLMNKDKDFNPTLKTIVNILAA